MVVGNIHYYFMAAWQFLASQVGNTDNAITVVIVAHINNTTVEHFMNSNTVATVPHIDNINTVATVEY